MGRLQIVPHIHDNFDEAPISLKLLFTHLISGICGLGLTYAKNQLCYWDQLCFV